MKKRNYRENFFIVEKFSVIYITKERYYFISLLYYTVFTYSYRSNNFILRIDI